MIRTYNLCVEVTVNMRCTKDYMIRGERRDIAMTDFNLTNLKSVNCFLY